jgi:hypothetical protein
VGDNVSGDAMSGEPICGDEVGSVLIAGSDLVENGDRRVWRHRPVSFRFGKRDFIDRPWGSFSGRGERGRRLRPEADPQGPCVGGWVTPVPERGELDGAITAGTGYSEICGRSRSAVADAWAAKLPPKLPGTGTQGGEGDDF